MRRALFLALLAVVACGNPLAQVDLVDIRLSKVSDTDGRLVAEVDVRATESGGGNVGVYCVEVTYGGQSTPIRSCNDDLTDGDTRTVRLTSDVAIGAGTLLTVAARLATFIDSETRLAP